MASDGVDQHVDAFMRLEASDVADMKRPCCLDRGTAWVKSLDVHTEWQNLDRSRESLVSSDATSGFVANVDSGRST
jgi:hypothetical protein